MIVNEAVQAIYFFVSRESLRLLYFDNLVRDAVNGSKIRKQLCTNSALSHGCRSGKV